MCHCAQRGWQFLQLAHSFRQIKLKPINLVHVTRSEAHAFHHGQTLLLWESEVGCQLFLFVVVFEVEVGAGELGLDDFPEPVHWRTKCDIRRIG